MPDRTIIFSTNGRHGLRGLSQVNPQEFSAYQDDNDDLTYVADVSAYADGATISSVTRTPYGLVVTNTSNTTTRISQRLKGFGYVDIKYVTTAGDTDQFRINIVPRVESVFGQGAQQAIAMPLAYTSVSDPTINDDSVDGHIQGTLWLNTVTLNEFRCISNAVGAAIWRHIPRIIAQSNTIATCPANTSANVLATFTLLAGTMGVAGELVVENFWSCTNNANAKTGTVIFGGASYPSQAMASAASQHDRTFIRNQTLTNQFGRVNGAGAGGYAISTGSFTTSAVNTANDVVVQITGQKASAGDTLSLEGYTVLLNRPDIGPT